MNSDNAREELSGPKRLLQHYIQPYPFEGLSPAEVWSAVKEDGATHRKLFPQLVQDLADLLEGVNPVLLLAHLSFYGLTSHAGKKTEWEQQEPLLQHHLEILQAMALRSSLKRKEEQFFSPEVAAQLTKSVQTTCTASHKQRNDRVEPLATTPNQHRRLALEQMRLHHQAVRNWGYIDQVLQIVRDLFAPIDHELGAKIGIRVAEVCDLYSRVLEEMDRRLNNHVARVRSFLTRADRPAEVITAYTRAFPEDCLDEQDLRRIAREQRICPTDLKAALLTRSDCALPELYIFTTSDFARMGVDVSVPSLEHLLDSWSYRFGDLADHDPERLFQENPIWKRPLICLDEGLYFWPIPSLFISFCLDLLEEMVKPHDSLFLKYENRRGAFFEDQVERLIRSAFPQAEVFRGSLWKDENGQEFENDILAVIDSHALIVEARSGRVRDFGKHATESRLITKLKDLVVKPAAQTARFATFLQERRVVHEFATKHGTVNRVDLSNVQEIIRLSVILEPVGDLIVRLPALQFAGLIPSDSAIAPTLCLSDLMTVLELLDTPGRKLHYLVRRGEFEQRARYYGDETDLLALYLDTGFNLGDVESDRTNIVVYGASAAIDPYFNRARSKQPARKPSPRMARWWRNILSMVEERGFPRWSEVVHILLNVSPEDQDRFAREFRVIKQGVSNGSRDPDSLILICGPKHRRDAVAACAYRGLSRHERDSRLQKLARQIEPPPDGIMPRRLLIIGCDLDVTDIPYSVLQVFDFAEPDCDTASE